MMLIEALSSKMYVYVCVAHRVLVVDRPTNRVAGRSRAHGRGRSGAAGDDDSNDEAPFQSYDDQDDDESLIPPFSPQKTPGF